LKGEGLNNPELSEASARSGGFEAGEFALTPGLALSADLLGREQQPLRCQLWGVLNVTPDSFSDGGLYLDPHAAVERAHQMVNEGAHVIDIGGQSTRPRSKAYGQGALKVSVDEELARVVPVVQRLRQQLTVPISVDTTCPAVALRALEAGASIINDVSCGANTELLGAAAKHRAKLVLMHSRSQGEHEGHATHYADIVEDVCLELQTAVSRALEQGVDAAQVWVDPGIGFAKTAKQSRALLANLDPLLDLGYPVLVGASRKSFIAETIGDYQGRRLMPDERLAGSLSALVLAIWSGAAAVRVHDVAASYQAMQMVLAMRDARIEPQRGGSL